MEKLQQDIENLKLIISRLIKFIITVVIIVPWSAIFLGVKAGVWLGMLSLVISLIIVKALQVKKIL